MKHTHVKYWEFDQKRWFHSKESMADLKKKKKNNNEETKVVHTKHELQ